MWVPSLVLKKSTCSHTTLQPRSRSVCALVLSELQKASHTSTPQPFGKYSAICCHVSGGVQQSSLCLSKVVRKSITYLYATLISRQFVLACMVVRSPLCQNMLHILRVTVVTFPQGGIDELIVGVPIFTRCHATLSRVIFSHDYCDRRALGLGFAVNRRVGNHHQGVP